MKKYIIAIFLFILIIPVKAQFHIMTGSSVDTVYNVIFLPSLDSITGTIYKRDGMENAVLGGLSNAINFTIDFIRINPDNDKFYIKLKDYMSIDLYMRINMMPRESVQFYEVEAEYNKDIMSIFPNPEAWKYVRKGDDYIFNATPKAGHEYDSIVVKVENSDEYDAISVNQSTKRCEIKNVQGDLNVKVTFIPFYEITIPTSITGGAGATIINRAPSGRVEEGKDFTFKVDRNEITDSILVTTNPGGYEGKIDINQNSGECTIRNVQDDLIVTVALIPTYEITISSIIGGAGASIINRVPSGRIGKGEDFTCMVKRTDITDSILVTITPGGYEGKIDINQNSGECTIRGVQHSLNVTVTLIPTHVITILPISGATIIPATWGRIETGTDFTFTVNRNNINDSILINIAPGGYEGKIEINQTTGICTIRDVQNDLTVTVTLIPTYEITIPAITGATITPATWSRVATGTDFTFTVNKNSGYENYLFDITVDKPDKCGTISVDQTTGACQITDVQNDLTIMLTLTQFLQDTELRRWIANHQKAFTDYGVKVENDGTIIFTPENQAALASMTSLEITDSEAMLAIDTSPGGPLPQSDYTITTMDDLLMFMPNLKHLNCSGNKLTSLDLSANKELESLYCTKNKLTYLDISETEITGMFMSRDQAQPFVMKVMRSQYRMMQGGSVLPYPSWTEFIFTDDEDPGYPSPIIYRKIVLNPCEGLTITPAAGTHYIASGRNFSFRYNVRDGYGAENIKITTGVRLYDEHIKTISESDGNTLVTIYAVRHAIEINIMGVEPASGVSNIMINEEAPLVWSYQHMLYIRTPYATEIAIYDTKGVLHKKEQVTVGQKSLFLPKGMYIVRFDGDRTQKIVIR